MNKPVLVIILLAGIMAGCKKNEMQKTAEVTLIGKWYVKAVIGSGGLNAGSNTSFTDQDYYEFNSNNTVNTSQSLQGIKASLHYTYTKDSSGEKIAISTVDRTDTYTVNKLTADSLVMNNTATVNSLGAIATNNVTYKFARK